MYTKIMSWWLLTLRCASAAKPDLVALLFAIFGWEFTGYRNGIGRNERRRRRVFEIIVYFTRPWSTVINSIMCRRVRSVLRRTTFEQDWSKITTDWVTGVDGELSSANRTVPYGCITFVVSRTLPTTMTTTGRRRWLRRRRHITQQPPARDSTVTINHIQCCYYL